MDKQSNKHSLELKELFNQTSDLPFHQEDQVVKLSLMASKVHSSKEIVNSKHTKMKSLEKLPRQKKTFKELPKILDLLKLHSHPEDSNCLSKAFHQLRLS